MHMEVAKEFGLKWKPNVAAPVFAPCNDEKMLWGFASV